MLRRLLGALRRPVRPARVRHPYGGVAAPRDRGGAREYHGPVVVEYAPDLDGSPDPGEVVWTWVPYEDDPAVGKDRPVVVVGRAPSAGPGRLAVLMLSSREHPDDPRWLPLGAGGWDAQGRPSSVRLDRVLAVAPAAVRREGAVLDRPRFDRVVAALARTGRRG